MPNISDKGLRMPESPIRKLVPFAENAKMRGIDVIHLNIGQPDIKTPEVALEAIKNFEPKVVAYSHSAGFQSYREGLANYYKNVGLNVTHQNILVTTGGSEAITMSLNSIMDQGDEIIIPEPFYANYNGFSTAAGVKVKPISSSINSGFSLPEISEFEKLITPKTKAILICNPGNPTGYLYAQEELNSLRALVLKYDLFLIADEVYREFAYDGKKHISILDLDGLEQNAIVIDSVSKRYSMCGARVGCIVSKNKELMATAMKFAQARLSPPTLEQIAAEAAAAAQLPENKTGIQAAVVSIDNATGGVRAMVGGTGFVPVSNEINLALRRRQTGSSVKIFILAAALQAGILPDDVIDGTLPCTLPNPGKPEEPFYISKGVSYQVAPLRTMTALSINCAYAKLSQVVGLERVVSLMYKVFVQFLPSQNNRTDLVGFWKNNQEAREILKEKSPKDYEEVEQLFKERANEISSNKGDN